MKNMFNAVPISILFVSKIEALFATGSLKWSRTINEKDRVIYLVFVTEFRKKLICNHIVFDRFKPYVYQIISFRIDNSIQQILFITELNHSLINRNVIRATIRFWLYIDFVNSVVNG